MPVTKKTRRKRKEEEREKQMVIYMIHLTATDKWQCKGSGVKLRKGWLKIT